jgi:formate dehydrogenase subunit delta
MANQIADFFRAYPRERAVEGIATHLRKFWDPRMRRRLNERIQRGDTHGLDELVLAAVREKGLGLGPEQPAPRPGPPDARQSEG